MRRKINGIFRHKEEEKQRIPQSYLCLVMRMEMQTYLNYWVFGLCPSSGVLRKHNVSKTGSVFVLRCREEGHLLSSVRLKELTWITWQIQFSKLCMFFLEYETMDKVQNLSSPDCNTPPSETCRIGWHTCVQIRRLYGVCLPSESSDFSNLTNYTA
jgi:hypothetical protein